MSIGSISSSMVSGLMPQRPAENTTPLTDDQKQTLSDILSQYDSANMTEDDWESLRQDMMDAGISPNKEVRETMDAAGFEPPKPPEGAGGPPPMQGAEQSESSTDSTSSTDAETQLAQLLQNLIDQIQNGDVSDTDISSILQNLQQQGLGTTGIFVDQSA